MKPVLLLLSHVVCMLKVNAALPWNDLCDYLFSLLHSVRLCTGSSVGEGSFKMVSLSCNSFILCGIIIVFTCISFLFCSKFDQGIARRNPEWPHTCRLWIYLVSVTNEMGRDGKRGGGGRVWEQASLQSGHVLWYSASSRIQEETNFIRNWNMRNRWSSISTSYATCLVWIQMTLQPPKKNVGQSLDRTACPNHFWLHNFECHGRKYSHSFCPVV